MPGYIFRLSSLYQYLDTFTDGTEAFLDCTDLGIL